MRTKPHNKQQFEMRLARVREHCLKNSPMMRIPPIAAMECELVLRAYHGGVWRLIWALIKAGLREQMLGPLVAIWISDRMGWTKVYDVPETAEFRAHKQRHGRKCSGSPNCQNYNCIRDSQPRWFKWLFRLEDFPE